MDCSSIQSMIEPFLHDELSGQDRDSFISHVRECKTCREELEVYHIIYSVVSQLDNNTEDETIDYCATLEKKLSRQAATIKRGHFFRQALRVLLLIAVLIVALIIIL